MATIRAFMFHDVRDANNYPKRYNLRSFLNTNQFQFQITEISKKYKIISSEEIKDVDLKNDSNNYAILTFDDGLLDHFQVYKYLKSLNLSATFLIPKAPIIKGIVMNTHKIQFILAVCDENVIKDEILSFFNDKEKIWKKYSQSKWKNNWWSDSMIFVTNFLRKHKCDKVDNYEMTNFLFDKYVTKNELNFSKDLYLNLNHIEEMCNSGMIIGGHGNISENLTLIENYKSDILESKQFISKYSENFIFSYPNGGYDQNIKKYMQEINCKLAYTTVQKTITELDEIDFLEFPRYDSPQKINLP